MPHTALLSHILIPSYTIKNLDKFIIFSFFFCIIPSYSIKKINTTLCYLFPIRFIRLTSFPPPGTPLKRYTPLLFFHFHVTSLPSYFIKKLNISLSSPSLRLVTTYSTKKLTNYSFIPFPIMDFPHTSLNRLTQPFLFPLPARSP